MILSILSRYAGSTAMLSPDFQTQLEKAGWGIPARAARKFRKKYMELVEPPEYMKA